MSLPLKWVRPTDVPYPKIWMTFKERDANSDKLVEYRIQDLPESMFEDAIKLMANVCVADEPLVASYSKEKNMREICKLKVAYKTAFSLFRCHK